MQQGRVAAVLDVVEARLPRPEFLLVDQVDRAPESLSVASVLPVCV
jgi:hypothetical protein